MQKVTTSLLPQGFAKSWKIKKNKERSRVTSFSWLCRRIWIKVKRGNAGQPSNITQRSPFLVLVTLLGVKTWDCTIKMQINHSQADPNKTKHKIKHKKHMTLNMDLEIPWPDRKLSYDFSLTSNNHGNPAKSAHSFTVYATIWLGLLQFSTKITPHMKI